MDTRLASWRATRTPPLTGGLSHASKAILRTMLHRNPEWIDVQKMMRILWATEESHTVISDPVNGACYGYPFGKVADDANSYIGWWCIASRVDNDSAIQPR